MVLLAACLALSACGGGGGGSTGGGGTSPGPATSGLLPAAPALGTTLETDVGRLRVLRAGSTWRYTGVVRVAGALPTAYTNVVTHVAAGTGVTESATNALDSGMDSRPVRIEAGAVKLTLPLNDFGVARSIDFVELRAPVRVGDQVTQIDERVAEAIEDLDGDGKREGLDIAIWTRVIGEESIDLLHRPGLRAIRLDTSIAVRLRPTAVGSPAQPTVVSVQRNWYAAGVGLVRTESETPSAAAPGSADTIVEELESWDGLTEGLGAQPAVIGRLPDSGIALRNSGPALAFDDHAVMLLNGSVAGADSDDRTLVSIDLQGKVTATYTVRIADTQVSFGPGDLLRVGNGLRVLHRVLGTQPGVVMSSHGPHGEPSGDAPVRLLDALPMAPLGVEQKVIATASTSNRIWLMWLRAAEGASSFSPFLADLVLQGFAPDGTPVSTPRVLLAQVDTRDVTDFNLAANTSHVLATWALNTTDHPYAVFDAASGSELARRTTTALSPFMVSSVPLALENQLALGWLGNAAGVVRLDENFNAVSTTPGDWQGDLLPTTSLLAVSVPRFSARSDTVLLWGLQNNLREPINNNGLTTLAMMTLSAGPGPLASRPLTVHGRLPLSNGEPLLVSGVLLFSDRLLAYGRNNEGALVTVLVWRQA
tara:strand:+ start:463 stop:2412 length:1950 start_codon:yes stop_codon:yes gene_type:complete